MQPPPRSTLFPYTTLFRSHADRLFDAAVLIVGVGWQQDRVRSEEHTSELQSHSDLVCRLLLEKKNSVQRRTRAITSCQSYQVTVRRKFSGRRGPEPARVGR